MSNRAVFEPELEDNTIVLWEAGNGTRVFYPTEATAQRAYEFLLGASRRYHLFRKVYVFADNIVFTEFIKRYKEVVWRFGLKIDSTLTRPQTEYW